MKPIRCVGLDSNGEQCGKYARRGFDTCFFHDPNYKPTGIIATQAASPKKQRTPPQPPDGLDDEQLLDWATKHGDAGERLRALELKFKWRERQDGNGCPICRTRREHDEEMSYIFRVMTTVERELLDTIITEFVRLKQEILDEQRPLPKRETNAAILQRNQPTRGTETIPEPTGRDDSADTDVAAPADPDAEGRRQERLVLTDELSDEQLESVGCYLVRGVWSHPRGDEHAAKIRTGAISYEQAHKDFLAAQREDQLLNRSN